MNHFASSCASCRQPDGSAGVGRHLTMRSTIERRTRTANDSSACRPPAADSDAMTIGSGISSSAPGTCPSPPELGVPRSSARGWLVAAPRVVVSVEVADLTEPELRHEILKLRRRVEKLAALLRLALALLDASGFSLKRASGRTGQAADPARRRTRARMYAVASGPSVPWSVTEPLSVLGSTADPGVPSTISRLALAPHRID